MTRYLQASIKMLQDQYDLSDSDLLWLISLGASEEMKRALIDNDDRTTKMKFVRDCARYLSKGDDIFE